MGLRSKWVSGSGGTEEQCANREFITRAGNQTCLFRSEERLECNRFVGRSENRTGTVWKV